MDVVIEFETRARADVSSELDIQQVPLENPSCSVLAALNEPRFAGAQMRAAVDAIKHVPLCTPADIAEHCLRLFPMPRPTPPRRLVREADMTQSNGRFFAFCQSQ